jgi:hypothetical protein
MHIHDIIEEKVREKGPDAGLFAIAYALLELTEQSRKSANALERLGLNEAATPMGAIELLSSEVRRIANAMEALADPRGDTSDDPV